MIPARKKIVLGRAFSEAQIRAVTEATLRAIGYREPSPPPHDIGELVAGQGVYLGRYSTAEDGTGLGKIFNVFAAPEDLGYDSGKREIFNYSDALERISELREWHGHDGAYYRTDTALRKALEEGSYAGEWVMPMRAVVAGEGADGIIVQPDNIFAHREKGALQGTIVTNSTSAESPHFYWTSTEGNADTSCAWMVRMTDGAQGRYQKSVGRFSCRPVRFVPV